MSRNLVIKVNDNLIPEGRWPATCTDVEFVDDHATPWSDTPVDMVRLTFDVVTDDGTVTAQRMFTRKLSERAHLRKAIDAWRGHPLTDAEAQRGEVDLAEFVGAPASVSITHNKKGDRIYSDIDEILPRNAS